MYLFRVSSKLFNWIFVSDIIFFELMTIYSVNLLEQRLSDCPTVDWCLPEQSHHDFMISIFIYLSQRDQRSKTSDDKTNTL